MVTENEEGYLIAEGFDDCIVGFSTKGIVVYDANKMIAKLIERDGMTDEEAVEFFNFNIECAYVGEKTPVYAWLEQDDIDEVLNA